MDPIVRIVPKNLNAKHFRGMHKRSNNVDHTCARHAIKIAQIHVDQVSDIVDCLDTDNTKTLKVNTIEINQHTNANADDK